MTIPYIFVLHAETKEINISVYLSVCVCSRLYSSVVRCGNVQARKKSGKREKGGQVELTLGNSCRGSGMPCGGASL